MGVGIIGCGQMFYHFFCAKNEGFEVVTILNYCRETEFEDLKCGHYLYENMQLLHVDFMFIIVVVNFQILCLLILVQLSSFAIFTDIFV